MKIPYYEWAKKNNIPKMAAKNLLHRKILEDPAMKGRVKKERIFLETWHIDEDVRPIKTEGGKWELI